MAEIDTQKVLGQDFDTDAAVIVRLAHGWHRFVNDPGGSGKGSGAIPVIDATTGEFVAWAHKNPDTGIYEYDAGDTTYVTETGTGPSSTSDGTSFGSLVNTGGSSGPSQSVETGAVAQTPRAVEQPQSHREQEEEPEDDDPFGGDIISISGVSPDAAVDALHTHYSLPCPGSNSNSARIQASEINNPTNTSQDRDVWIGSLDADGSVMKEGRVVLEPGKSLERYNAQPGAVGIVIACGGPVPGGGSAIATLRFQNLIA